MPKLGQSIMRSIEGGKRRDRADQGAPDDAFAEAGLSESVAVQSGGIEDPTLDLPEEIFVQPEVEPRGEPEPIPVSEQPNQKSRKSNPGGGKILIASALTISLAALVASGYIGFQQVTGEVNVSQSISDIKESLSALASRDNEIAEDLSDTQSIVQVNGSRVTTIEQFGRDLRTMQVAIEDIHVELGGIKTVLDTQKKVIDEHRQDIDNMGKQVKILNDRPVVKTIVQKVAAPAPQPQLNHSLEGATVASIDMWGSQPYVVLRDRNGGWIPLQTGEYYQGWRLQGAVGNEAIFKSGSKTRRLAVE